MQLQRLKRLSNGQWLTLETEIARGGEGVVWKILENPSLVAKIYYPGKMTPEQERKLAVMYANPPDDPMKGQGHPSIAWAVDLLILGNGNNQIVGFLMSNVSGMSPTFTYYNPSDRRQESPLFNYKYLHRTARNLAAAVCSLHARGYVIGDVNESNILVSNTALVTLVDTDSFQVRDGYTVYRCPVGKPEFTPPELQGQTFRQIDRSPEHDLFGLAVVIFRLLMEGTHPFDGVFTGQGESPLTEVRIQSGHFPYGTKQVPYRPKPLAPPVEILHPNLQQLFGLCFEVGHKDPKARPTAQAWQNVLEEAENALIVCSVNEQHFYNDRLKTCPWCERTKKLGGRDPFPSFKAVKQGKNLQPLSSAQTPLPFPKIPKSIPLSLPSLKLSKFALQNFLLNLLKAGGKKLAPLKVALGTGIFLLLMSQIYGSFQYGSFPSNPIVLIRNRIALQKTLHLDITAITGVKFDGKNLWTYSIPYEILVKNAEHEGHKIPTFGRGRAFTIWNWNSGQIISSLPVHSNYLTSNAKQFVEESDEEYNRECNFITFSPNVQITAISNGENITIFRNNQKVRTLSANRSFSPRFSVAFSPDGKVIASSVNDHFNNVIKLWDWQTGQVIQTIYPKEWFYHDGRYYHIAFSPDGQTFATSKDRTITIWNWHTGQEIQTLFAHKRAVESIAFSEDGQFLAGSDDETVRVWKVR